MFAGLPTPAAAATIASFAILSYSLRNEVAIVTHENFERYDWWMQRLVPLISVIIAILMVSRVPYPHPLTQFIRGQRSFAQLVAIVFSLMAILIVRNYAIPLLCLLFVCIPPIRFAWDTLWHRRAREESLF
jgi:CDP-diacylglycerol--serine O-phosphatidyltransferase